MTKPLNKFRKSLRSKAKAAREPVITIARVGHDPATLRRVARELRDKSTKFVQRNEFNGYAQVAAAVAENTLLAESRRFTREARAASKAGKLGK